MTVEEWRPVPSQPGYEASSLGRIRSVPRAIVRRNGNPMKLRSYLLRPQPNGADGRHTVRPSVVGRGPQTKLVHYLVAEAFYGPRPNGGVQVRHLNGNHLDNRVENLQYGSQSENRLDSVRHGTHIQARKKACPRGHVYEPWNLVLSLLPRERKCLACKRARNYCQYHPELDFVELSHQYYDEIIKRLATCPGP